MCAKSKLDSIEVIISMVLIDAKTRNKLVLMNNVLKEYNNMKEEIKTLKT